MRSLTSAGLALAMCTLAAGGESYQPQRRQRRKIDKFDATRMRYEGRAHVADTDEANRPLTRQERRRLEREAAKREAQQTRQREKAERCLRR